MNIHNFRGLLESAQLLCTCSEDTEVMEFYISSVFIILGCQTRLGQQQEPLTCFTRVTGKAASCVEEMCFLDPHITNSSVWYQNIGYLVLKVSSLCLLQQVSNQQLQCDARAINSSYTDTQLILMVPLFDPPCDLKRRLDEARSPPRNVFLGIID